MTDESDEAEVERGPLSLVGGDLVHVKDGVVALDGSTAPAARGARLDLIFEESDQAFSVGAAWAVGHPDLKGQATTPALTHKVTDRRSHVDVTLYRRMASTGTTPDGVSSRHHDTSRAIATAAGGSGEWSGLVVSGSVQAYVLAARAPATRRAYASDWAHFDAWCTARTDQTGRVVSALPASAAVVATYLSELAGALTPATLTRRCSAISTVHQAAGHPTPTTTALVRTTMAGIRRTHGAPPAAKAPLLAHQIRRLLDALPTDHAHQLQAARDRALLVIGFYGALRRSELVALDRRDVEVNDHGLVLTLRRSKTDQDGAGRRIALLHTGSPDSCPVETYQTWTHLQRCARTSEAGADRSPTSPEATGAAAAAPAGTGPSPGAVFCGVNRHGQPAATRLSDRSVARIIQRTTARAGLGGLDVAGHSLRSGFATSAAAAGKSERSIMKQTGHTSLPMVRRYIREGSLYRDNPTDGITL